MWTRVFLIIFHGMLIESRRPSPRSDGGRYRPMQRVNHCADTASVVVAI